MMRFLKKNKKGFTLVELIVVIAILGILAAIVVPRLGAFREGANLAHDRATLRTVQGAVNMFYAERGIWPETGTGTSAANYTALVTPLTGFMEMVGDPAAMPVARSTSGTTLRQFQYNPATGVVSINPALPPLN